MRHTILAAVSAVLIASPALAQSPDATNSTPPPPRDCQTLAKTLGFVQSNPRTVIEPVADGCRIRDFHANFGSYNRYRIGEATLVAPGLFDAFANQTPPEQLDLTLSGFKVSPDAGGPVMTYMMEMQADPMTIHLNYRWDKAEKTLELADFSLDVEEFGGFRLAAKVSDFDFDPERLKQAETAPGRIDRVSFDLDNARLFTAFIVPTLLSQLPADADPVPAIENYKKMASAFIDGLPAENTSQDSKAALKGFVADFPRPRGKYSLELSADPGVGMKELTGFAGLTAILARTKIEATRQERKVVIE